MIRIKYIDGEWCPILECHHCGQEIRDHHLGIAVWGDSVPVRYVHKQTCDDRSLNYSEELAEHFGDLLFNIGVGRDAQ